MWDEITYPSPNFNGITDNIDRLMLHQVVDNPLVDEELIVNNDLILNPGMWIDRNTD